MNALASSLLVLIAVATVGVVYVVRRTVRLRDEAVKIYGPNTSICTGQDLMWSFETETNRMIINAMWEVEMTDIASIRRMIMEGIVKVPHYRKFCQKLICYRGAYLWVDDKEFSIERHVVLVNGEGAPKNEAEWEEFCGRKCAESLPVDRPLWVVYVIEDFADKKTLVLWRLHHVIGDGVAMASLTFNMLNTHEDLTAGHNLSVPKGEGLRMDETSTKVAQKERTRNATVLKILAALHCLPWTIGMVVMKSDRHALKPQYVTGRKYVKISSLFPLDQVKAIKNKLGVTVNDVLMGVLGCAIHRTLKKMDPKGERGTPDYIKAFVPVNMRFSKAPPKMENRMSTPTLMIPVHTADPEAAIYGLKSNMDRLKKSIEPFTFYYVVKLLSEIFPPPVIRWISDFCAAKGTAVVSNLPAPGVPLFVGDKRLLSAYFWVPQKTTCGLGVSMLTMSGELGIGVLSDEIATTDPKMLVDEYMAVLHDLAKKYV